MPVRDAEKKEKEQWVVDIERKYGSYDPGKYDEMKKRRSIYKWPYDLVAASSLSHHRAPRTVSLGPYHHGKKHLQPMEHHKERALHRILHRSNIPVTTFIQSLQDVEQELRDSYDNLDLKLLPHLFLRMMLFDGCFLLEVLRILDSSIDSSNEPFFVSDGGSSEPFFGSDGGSLVAVIQQDMLILENQIPLLVLEKLLEVEEGNQMNNRQYLNQLVPKFYGFDFPIDGPFLHILDIYRECLIGGSTTRGENGTPISVCSRFEPWLRPAGKGLKRMIIALPILVFWLLHGGIPKHGHFRTVTRLHEAGIEFKKGEPGLTITFDEKNGVITLPYIQLTDTSAIFFMNLMAFERMHPPLSGEEKVTNYMALLDELIDTVEDVSVLCSQGILSNHLASDEDAAKLFNAFSDGLVFCEDSTRALREQWQRYAASDWNRAVAHLNHNYFQNPWSVVSLLAAIIFLVLTIIQTVFSGMQTLKNGE